MEERRAERSLPPAPRRGESEVCRAISGAISASAAVAKSSGGRKGKGEAMIGLYRRSGRRESLVQSGYGGQSGYGVKLDAEGLWRKP